MVCLPATRYNARLKNLSLIRGLQPHAPFPLAGSDRDSNGEINWNRSEEEQEQRYRQPKPRPKVR